MKKFNVESMRKFIDYKKPKHDTVLLLFEIQLFAYFLITVLSYNWKKSLLLFIPFIVLSITLILLFKKIKKPQIKLVNLFCGIQGLLLSLICQFGCFLVVKLEFDEIVRLSFLLISLNLIVICVVVFLSASLVRAKRFPADIPISITLISSAALIGRTISRKMEHINIIPIALIGFSCIASVLVVYLLKYYYSNIIEKLIEHSENFPDCSEDTDSDSVS